MTAKEKLKGLFSRCDCGRRYWERNTHLYGCPKRKHTDMDRENSKLGYSGPFWDLDTDGLQHGDTWGL